MILHIFNPENDLALADGGANYCPPPAAAQIAYDLGTLPLWFAGCGDAVLLPAGVHKDYYDALSSIFGLAAPFDTAHCSSLSKVVPWGWSPQIKRRLKAMGISEEVLPSDDGIDKLRALSNRRTAVYVLHALKGRGIDTPASPVYLTSADDVAAFVGSVPRSVVKAPWSGSGKGIMWGLGRVEVPLENFYKGIIRRQGGVVCEYFLDSQQEFAMEFLASAEGVRFAGYSLFESEKGSYSGNLLAADVVIEKMLSHYIPLEDILNVRENLCEILSSLLLDSGYTGYLGVDMMIYRDADGGLRLNPCMEINLRMNMGVVSRIVYDRYVATDRRGRFFVTYYKKTGDAFNEHVINKEMHPLKVDNGRVVSGYLNLAPVTLESKYSAYILVDG